MLKNGRLTPGTEVRIEAAFEDQYGVAVDPTAVTFMTINPVGRIKTYTYGVDTELQRATTGDYTCDITPDLAGRWTYRWQTTGSGTALVMEDDFVVKTSPFVPDPYLARIDYR